MDAKEAGNVVFVVGETKQELGGSHFSLVNELTGGQVPTVDAIRAKKIFATIHEAIRNRLVRSCHDLSEGGLAVAATEMAMAGGLGMAIDISQVCNAGLTPTEALFSESNTRFLVEVAEKNADDFQRLFQQRELPVSRLGTIEPAGQLVVTYSDEVALQVDIAEAKAAWQKPLDWH